MSVDLFLISILEGATEFLPISSTAHLILAGKFLAIDLTDPYIKFYLLAIQVGALFAGVMLFAKKILTDKSLLLNLLISFLPSAAIGFVLYKMFKHLLEGNLPLIAAMLFLGGVIFIYLEKKFMRKGGIVDIHDFGTIEISKMDAFVVGIAQAAAIVPGVSRSGATIVAGILRGIKKAVIIEYTFLLALPTLGAAVLYDAYKSRDALSSLTSYQELLLGCLIALTVGLITLYVLKKYLQRLSLTAFGWYRIALALVILLALFV